MEALVAERSATSAKPEAKMLAYLSVTEDLRVNEESKLQLLLQVKSLQETLSVAKEDQRDIYFYLNKKCDDSYEMIAQLEEQLSLEQEDREVCERALEQRVAELEGKLRVEEERSRQQIGVLEDKLSGLEKFHDTQIILERQILELKETLEKERRESAARLQEVDLQNTVVRDKMRKEKEQAMADLRVEMNQSLESRMPAAVQKTLLINSLIKRELQQVGATAMDVLDRDRQIQQTSKEMKLELSLAQDLDKELTSKLSTYTRTIKALQEQMARDADVKEQTKRDNIAKIHQRDAEIATLRHLLQSLEHRLSDAIDTQRLREVWFFLSEAYEAHSGPRHVNTDKIQQLPLPPEWTNQQERLLVFLVRSLLLRYPSKFQHILGLPSEYSFELGLPEPYSQGSSRLSPSASSFSSPARNDSSTHGVADGKNLGASESAPHPSRSRDATPQSGRLATSESMQAFRNVFLPLGMSEGSIHSVISANSGNTQSVGGGGSIKSSSTPVIPSRKSSHPAPGRPTRAFATAGTSSDSQSVASISSYSSNSTGMASQIQSRPGGSFGHKGPRQVAQLNMRGLISDKILKSVGDVEGSFRGSLSGIGAGQRSNQRLVQLGLSTLAQPGSYEAMLSPASSVSMTPRELGTLGVDSDGSGTYQGYEDQLAGWGLELDTAE